MIQRQRHVFHIPGYDPVSPRSFQDRFVRQLQYFKQTWSVEAELFDAKAPAEFPTWKVEASGPNWRAVTAFELLAWDDIIGLEARRSRLTRLGRAILSYADLIVTGTIFRYASANLRYFAFALVPLLQLLLFAGLALSFALALRYWIETAPACGVRAGNRRRRCAVLPAAAVARDHMASRSGAGRLVLFLWRTSTARVAISTIGCSNLRARIVECARDGADDEILIVGHSLGATFAVDALVRALEMDPEIGQAESRRFAGDRRRHHSEMRSASGGSPAARTGAQAGARSIGVLGRAAIPRRLDQLLSLRPRRDAPIAKESDRLDGKPLIRRVHVRDMLRPETYAKYRLQTVASALPVRQRQRPPGGL